MPGVCLLRAERAGHGAEVGEKGGLGQGRTDRPTQTQ